MSSCPQRLCPDDEDERISVPSLVIRRTPSTTARSNSCCCPMGHIVPLLDSTPTSGVAEGSNVTARLERPLDEAFAESRRDSSSLQLVAEVKAAALCARWGWATTGSSIRCLPRP